MVISSLSPLASATAPRLYLLHPNHTPRSARSRLSPALPFAGSAASSKRTLISSSIDQNPPRSLFPGGYKRPEIRVPNLVLRLSAEDVLRDDKALLDVIDGAVSGRVGIVVLTSGEGSGKKLYEAACLLKSVIRDRAYLLIDERVDIAAAVNASGVLLSDQGLPTIVARNTMMDAKTDSVILPLVGRNVQTLEAALDASNSEGADFLIYTIKDGDHLEELVSSVCGRVKIPIFILTDFTRDEMFSKIPLGSLTSGVDGVVVSVDELNSSRDNDLMKLFYSEYARGQVFDSLETLGAQNGIYGQQMVGGFTRLEEREKQFIETERSILLEAINVIERATPLMGDILLLKDAVSQLDEPFSLVIVGEFNSGKSSVINAFLGQRYLKDGVVPTTNEITFLRYSDSEFSEQSCERHPDGQYICYIPAPILKEMTIVDTPGTNVILQRQQRLTEEFVPRADLILFVMSADRPLTESEVAFLRYIQQWKKKIVFVLNKSDLYKCADELNEAIVFIKENTRKMLNAEQVTLYPVSARSALEAKLSAFSGLEKQEEYSNNPYPGANNFSDLEEYLYSFLDVSTNNGIERIRLKLQTPVEIAEQLLSSCQKLVTDEFQQAEQDLKMVNNILGSVKGYSLEVENESISWKRQILSLLEANELLRTKQEIGIAVIVEFSAAAASKLFEQEIREVLLDAFGGLGAAGLSASLLTSILPTTLEDLLALGLCSAGGLLAISNFSSRRQKVIDKVRRTVDALACQLEEAMQKDLVDATNTLNNYVTLISKPYQELAQNRVIKLSGTLDELKDIAGQLEELQIEIRNFHVSR
ncbi:FZO-like [Striga asiatica]|uniref:FZO-like n=1 Tax=Striga asiatica TaxID=4170 RepID=A0A5A7NWJ9_STRAF|nr:FZO-like [Striga asiatica]